MCRYSIESVFLSHDNAQASLALPNGTTKTI